MLRLLNCYLPFGPLLRSIGIPVSVRWPTLLLVLGAIHCLGTLYDAFANEPWLYSLEEEHSLFWSGAYSASLRPFPLPNVVAETTLWQAFIGWNLSGSLGLLFMGLLHLMSGSSLHVALTFLTCIIIWCYALIVLLYFFYLPALVLLVAAVGATLDLTGRKISHPYHGLSLSSVVSTFGPVPLLLAGVSHLIVALGYPRVFAPIDRIPFRKLSEIFLRLPASFGCQTTFWQVYVGSAIINGLACCAISTHTFLILNSKTSSQSLIILCRGGGLLLLLISLSYSLWMPKLVTATFLICLFLK